MREPPALSFVFNGPAVVQTAVCCQCFNKLPQTRSPLVHGKSPRVSERHGRGWGTPLLLATGVRRSWPEKCTTGCSILRNSSQECPRLNPKLLLGWACRDPHQHCLNPWVVGAGQFFPVSLNASRRQPLEKNERDELSIVHIHMRPYKSLRGLNPLFQEDRGF